MRKRVPGWIAVFVLAILAVPGFSSMLSDGPEGATFPPENTGAGAGFPQGRAPSRAAGAVRPDIILANISWSLDGPYDGASCTVMASVFNDGLSTPSAFQVEMYADGAAVGSPVVNGLPGGSMTTVKAAWTASSGPHELRAVADPGNIVAESNETNNFRLAYLDIPYPDIVISNVSWYPRDFQAGEKVTVATTVSNTGKGGTARQFGVSASVDQTGLANRIIDGLGAGGSALATFQWTAASGNHTLYIKADPGGAVPESNEVNNGQMARFGQGYPDIVAEDIAFSPAIPADGQPTAITAVVNNTGKGGTGRQFKVGFTVDGEHVGSADMWGLAPGASAPTSVSWKATSGHHDIAVVVDFASELDESVEGNNRLVRSLDVPWPDLVLRDLRLNPAVPTDGRPASVNVTVENVGNGSTLREFEVLLMVYGEQLATLAVPGLGAGAQMQLAASWTAIAGSHELRAVADSSRVVAEADETNGVLSETVNVPWPNIVVTAFNFTPQNPDAGTTVRLTATVSNAGPGNTSSGFETRFFAAGNEVGSVHMDGLAVGLPRNVSVDWTATPGESRLSFVADTGGSVAESSELDNSASATVRVPYPDIIVYGMHWTPANYTPGASLNVTVDMGNAGPGNQTGMLMLYLYSGSDLAASAQIPAIPAGANRTVGLSFTPTAVPAVLRAEADPENTVAELSETDNAIEMYFQNMSLVPRPRPLDIQLTNLRTYPQEPMDGDRVSVVATIRAANLTAGQSTDLDTFLVVDALQAAGQRTTLLAEEGIVTLEWTAVPGDHRLQVVADPQRELAEADEGNNMLPLDISVRPADVSITGLAPSWPNSTDGETASVACALANAGTGGTRRDIVASLFVDGEMVRTATQPGLAAGQNNSIVLSFPAQPGAHRITALVNSAGSVLESSRANNVAFSGIDVPVPDITVTAIDAPALADEGAPVTLTATVMNTGGGTTRAFQVAMFIDGVQIGRMTVSSILAGRTASVAAQWAARPGSHLVTVAADVACAIGESSEANNWLSRTGIDVESSDIEVVRTGVEGPPVAGADRLAWAEIRNRGAATSREMEIVFCVDDTQMRSVKLGGMPANSSSTVSQVLQLGSGGHTIIVVADALDSVQELDETNNFATVDTGSPVVPELAIAGLNVPPGAVDGEEVRIFVEVENGGTADFTGRFGAAVFVDGVLLADIPFDGLPAGGSTASSARWTASPGAHIFRGIVDRENTVAETDETDNEMHVQGAAVEQPDLTVRDISAVKAPGQEGTDTFTVIATVENIGGATFRPVHIEALADSSVLGSIELNGIPARTPTQVSLPVRALNPQRLTVVADYDGSIRENDEFDNEASADYAPVNATAGTRPDLSVSDISVAVDELTDGQPTVVFVTVDNTGNATSAGKVDVALCCTDGSRSQASLNGLLPGGSAVLGFPWTASGWTQTAGNVTFNATVNFRRSSTEWSFDGNELLRTFRVHMPDYNISRLVRWNTTEGLEAPMFAIVDNLGIGDSVRPATLDVFIGGKLHSEHSFSGLRAGERLTVPLGWQAESGYQDIRIEVDRHSQVQESDEANNVYFDQVYTDYPELSVACITWAPHPDNGSVLTVFAEVHNTGTGATGRPFQFSHSADSADAETTTLFGLAANSSTIVSWKWALQPGEHVFTATADSNGAVREPNENDNRLMVDYPSGRARPIPPFLNIVVENITYRQSANRTGDISQNILTLVVSVQNDGQQDLPGSFLAIIADSILVVELNVPALAVNASAVLAYPWNATVANHTILVAADFRDQFPEDIETDNEKAILIEANDPPMAYAGGLRKATAGDPVKFRGSFGKDNDGYIALYEWDFDGDGKYDYSSAVSAEADHVYYKNGTYIARLRVTDDRGATSESTAAVKVRLEEARPLIRMDELTYAAMIASLTVLAMAAVLIYRKRDNG